MKTAKYTGFVVIFQDGPSNSLLAPRKLSCRRLRRLGSNRRSEIEGSNPSSVFLTSGPAAQVRGKGKWRRERDYSGSRPRLRPPPRAAELPRRLRRLGSNHRSDIDGFEPVDCFPFPRTRCAGPGERKMAEREGFEPSMELLTPYSLSRGAPSAARPSLRVRRNHFTATGTGYHGVFGAESEGIWGFGRRYGPRFRGPIRRWGITRSCWQILRRPSPARA